MTAEQGGPRPPFDQTQSFSKRDPFLYDREPRGFSEEEARREMDAIIRIVPDDENTDRIAQELGMRRIPEVDGQPMGLAILTSLPEDAIYDPAETHPESDAKYRIDGFPFTGLDGRKHRAYLSVFTPNGKTSPAHIHEDDIFEHYFIVEGEAFIGDGDNWRKMEPYEVIPPDTEHPIIAGDKGLVLRILLENAGDTPKEKIHVRRPKNTQPKETQVA